MKENNTITTIIISIVLSIFIALTAYFLLINYVIDADPLNDPILARANNLRNFYEQNHEGSIFILGSSYVLEGIDAYIVERLLKKNYINRSVYNLGMPDDAPLDRLGEIDDIIAQRPEIVIIGISYREFTNDTTINDDRLQLIPKRITNDVEFSSFFNDEQLKIISQNYLERLFYKRKYILPFIDRYVGGILLKDKKSSAIGVKMSRDPNLFISNFKDPWAGINNRTEAEKIEALKNTKYPNPTFEDSNSQKKALQYLITKLNQNKIPVIIINMPITPQYSNGVNESTRQNLSQFFNSTGLLWYDYEREYPSKYFEDNWHMNIAGRSDFSQKIATILVDYLEKGG